MADSESDLGGNGDGFQPTSEPLTFEKVKHMVEKCAKLLREMIATYHVEEKHVQDSWFSLLDTVVSQAKKNGFIIVIS